MPAYVSRNTSGIAPYSVGNKVYGGGRPMPNIGPVDKMGYRERDAKHNARKHAILRRLKDKSKGKFGSADVKREV